MEESYVNGVLNGELKEFYKNGKVFEEANFKNGQATGTIKQYDQSGKLVQKIKASQNFQKYLILAIPVQ